MRSLSLAGQISLIQNDMATDFTILTDKPAWIKTDAERDYPSTADLVEAGLPGTDFDDWVKWLGQLPKPKDLGNLLRDH